MNTRKIVPVHHKTLIRLFELDGFAVKRQKGDHIIMTKPGINRPLVIKTSPRKVPTAHILLDSACHAAEQTLLDQRLFMVSGKQYQTLMDLLERPPQVNEGIRDLFSRKAPWSVE